MTIEAELADGRILEFPDGTNPDVIQATVKRVMGASQKPAEPTFAERDRALATGIKSGLAGLAGLPMDTVQGGYNLLKAAVGVPLVAAGRADLAPEPTSGTPLSSEWIRNKLQGAGVEMTNPRPDDPASRMLNTAGTIVGGSMVPGATPVGTAAAAAGGAIAGEVLGPQYTALGAMAPAAASQGFREMRNAVASRAAPTVKAFEEAGATPSVGQATGSAFIQGLENLASKFPGGVGVMRKFAEAQQKAMGDKARTGVSAEDAGRAVEKGITGEGGFLQRSKETWKRLDNAVAARVPAGSTFAPANTAQALDDLTRPVQGAEKTTGGMVNPKIAEMKANLAADMQANNGVMPFESLRSLRTRVGSMLDDSLVSGVPNGELKKLYGALSKDLETAATQAGAGKEFARQNDFYRARMERIEGVLERVIGKNRQPEEIFKNLMPTDPDQANKLRGVLRSLEPDQRKVVTDAVVNRLGRANPSKQNDVGEVFSSETFLTNWNKLSDGAKAQIFPNHSMRQNVEAISKASSVVRDSGKVFSNPSGTAGAAAPYGLLAMAATGNVIPAAAMVSSTYLGAKMLTSPKVVEWLAKPVRTGSQEATAHLARLSVIYNQTDDAQLKSELEQFIQSAK